MVLRNVDLFIPGGNMTFIIGQSGSGKSTLGQLLLRFYLPALGEILLDGVPISKLEITWLRNRVTLVEQNSTLFEDTVFNNIALGRGDHMRVTKEAVDQAVEFALLQLMINDMPEGVSTVVGAKGNTMSGGQRQRMALARAYLRDTPVLLLDESTSALDQISRSLMMDAIRKWRKGKTTIIITHDISQIGPNEYAIIFEKGRVVQEGYRRHMERLKGSPFQSFLPEEEKAQLSPFDARRHTSLKPLVQAPSAVEPVLSVPKPAYVDDPLEAHLTAGEKNRSTFIPTAFANKHTSAILQGASKFGRPFSASRPQFSPNINVPSLSPVSDRASGFWLDKLDTQQITTAKPTSSPKPSERMDTFLDKTGMIAARTRLGNNRQRHRLPSDPPISLSPTKGKRRVLEKLRHPGVSYESHQEYQVQSVMSILRTIWPNLDWQTRGLMVVGFCCAAIGAAGTPVFSYILSKLIETYSMGSGGQHEAVIYLLSVLGLAGVTASCAYCQHMFLEHAGQQWVNRIREMALERVLDQPRDFFTQDENSISRITEGLDRNAEEMRNLLGRFSATVLTAFIMISVALVWALITDYKITLIALSVGPYVYVVTRAFGAVSGKWEVKSNDASEATGAIFFETFTTIKTVRALTLEKHFSERYFKATRNTLVIGIKRALWSGFFFGLSDVSGDFVMALIFYAGAVLVKQGAPASKIIQVFIQLIITINNVSNLLNYIPQMAMSRDMASRILRLAQLPKDSHEHLGNTRVTTTGDIVFTNLSFSYPSRPDQTILRNMSFTIPSGQCTAIVGSSGSGKSTIAALLLGLYTTTPEPFSSFSVPDLMISGRDIKHIHTPTLRSLITIVAQTPTIFASTVAENIAYGLPNDSLHNNLACIRNAATAAGIDDFIMTLPDQYVTPIGEGGIGLSGGQSQRISIARALIRNPSVMILDEATSALDFESAALIRHTLQSLIQQQRQMTIIIITHSRDMMAIADNVFVLDRGELVEQGGFEELVKRKGELYHLLSGGEWEGERRVRKSSGAVRGMQGFVDWGGSSVRSARPR